MKLSELKQSILDRNIADDLLILVYSTSNKDYNNKKSYENAKYLAQQYINEISEVTGKAKNYITSIYEPLNSNLSLVIDYEEKLNIVEVDEFNEPAENYYDFKNTIVVCTSINKKIAAAVADFTVDIPQPPEWAVKDYLHNMCPQLDSYDIEWLYKATEGNIYHCEQELSKFEAFPENERKQLFEQLKYDKNTDLFSISVFDVVRAIYNEQYDVIYSWAAHDKASSFDAIQFVTNLLEPLKLAVYFRLNHNITYTDAGFNTMGQVNFRLKDIPALSPTFLKNAINFLSGIDLRLKNNQLVDIKKETFIMYIIGKMQEIKRMG